VLALALAATALAAGLTSTWSPCGFSMVETIGRPPVGRGTRAGSCATFALGALAGGTVTFAGLAALGGLVHGSGGEIGSAIGVAVLLGAALGEARGVRVVPQIRRQVPEPWRRRLPLPLASALYGVLLGLGFTTFVLTLAVWALAALTFALGDPAIGLAVGLAFGAGRALPVVAIAPVLERPVALRALELMSERPSLLRGFRIAAAACLGCSALALTAAVATAAVPVTIGASDPSVAGGLLAWEAPAGGMLAREVGARTDPHRLGPGGILQLPGRRPALGGSMLAFRSGTAVRVVRAATLEPVAEVPVAAANGLAVSDGWLAYRAPRAGGGDRIAVRALAEPATERVLAETRPPGQLGRPAIAGAAVVFHVADSRSSRIVEVDLVTGRRRVLRQSRLEQLSNPAVAGGTLVYVRQSNLRQVLQVGPRRPAGRDRALLRAEGVARRDDGFEPGHSRTTLTPRAGRPATRLFWTTALSERFAYVSVLPVRGAAARPAILRVAR
jgi:hypothetical protein